MVRTFVVALALSMSACTLPAVLPEVNQEYKPTGEVLLGNRSSNFDAVRVRSPRCNLAKRTDGSWAGTFDTRPVDVNVYEDRLSGIGIQLSKRVENGKIVITGQVEGRIVRYELDDQRALIRTPAGSITLDGRVVGDGITTYGPRGELQLKGDAGKDVPPWPQFAFALLAAT